MGSIYYISFVMLAFNLTMEYGTLTKRFGPAIHVIVRVLSIAMVLGLLRLWDYQGWDKTSVLRYGITTLVFYFSCLLLFQESPAQKTFLYFMDFSATVFVASVCTWVSIQLPEGLLRNIVHGALFIGLLGTFLPVYFLFIRRRVQEMLSLFRQTRPLYAAFPACSFAFLVYKFGYLRASATPLWLIQLLLYGVMVILAYYILFSLFLTVYDRLRTQGDLAHAETQLNLQKKYFEELDRGLEAQRKFLHDTRHHMVAIAALSKARDFAAIDRYIEQVLDACSATEFRRYCDHSVINAIVCGYAKIAEEKGIAVSVELDIPPDLPIDGYKLCTLLGNTFENAIEACVRIPADSDRFVGRFVSVKAKTLSPWLVIRIENTVHEIPAGLRPDLTSIKGSGIGLKSVKKVVDQYGGCMSCDFVGSSFVFSAALSLATTVAGPNGPQTVP